MSVVVVHVSQSFDDTKSQAVVVADGAMVGLLLETHPRLRKTKFRATLQIALISTVLIFLYDRSVVFKRNVPF